MKITSLRFANLNSLRGEWSIDFSAPEYVCDGIFAITGPTGAGKTTILDAICLALYGRTPRHERVNASGNEIMSRQAGMCFAEVAFETAAGSFRCHWSQRRARMQPGGNLQPPQHEIVDAVSGAVLETKLRDVAVRVEAATGMDFERFTRSMLLAQGGFAAFLQAEPDERAPILEQLTGTDRYSRISICVHERLRDERGHLERLEAETAGISLLSEHERIDCQQEHERARHDEERLNRQLAAATAAIAWHETIEGLEAQRDHLQQQTAAIDRQLQDFATQRTRLAQAEAALQLEGAYATLGETRRQQKNDQQALRDAEARLPQQERVRKEAASALADCEQVLAQAHGDEREGRAAMTILRRLDFEIFQQAATLRTADEEYQQADEALAQLRTQLSDARQQRTRTVDLQQQVREYLGSHAADAMLVDEFAGIRERIAQLAAAREAAEQSAGRLAELQTEGERLSVQAADRAQQHRACADRQAAADRQVVVTQAARGEVLAGRLLREYRAEYSGLLREMALLNKIASLEDERNRLVSGQPCPLCGAREHPFAAGTMPTPDAIETRIAALEQLFGRADQLEEALQTAQQEATQARQATTEAELQLVHARQQLQQARDAVQQAQTEQQRAARDSATLAAGLSEVLAPLDCVVDADLTSLVQVLQERRQAWQAHQARQREFDKQLTKLEISLQAFEENLAQQTSVHAAKQQARDTAAQTNGDMAAQRSNRFGSVDPDREEQRLAQQVAAAEERVRAAREQRDAAHLQCARTSDTIAALASRIAARSAQLEGQEATFAQQLAQAGFADETEFVASRVPDAHLRQLRERARELDTRQAQTADRWQEVDAQLRTQQQRRLSDVPLETLRQQRADITDQLSLARQRIGAAAQRLADDTAARERHASKRAEIDRQQAECQRWGQLHALIGSADGKKYRNFAQGLTFEVMVAHANRQLQKMTDRYLLVRDDDRPLELNVIDNYQAGIVRSTRNLSGGESFIVSLALALGLSGMASRRVRVDSLFLDEGFGTLDEEGLEIALETLAGLQQEGKLIGIISHVAALKERIGTRISVRPLSGGRSAISGPGVERVG